MDPISIIGLAGSIVSIVDVATKSLKALNELRLRWLEADLTVMLLITQLGTLKAALGQIAEWINSSLAADPHQHYQLIIDLESALSCCKTLITLMDRHISKLEWNDHIDQPISFERRVRVALKDGAIKDCLNHLGNQTNALNLLLTAFNCRNQSEQRALLEKKKSRKIFEQIRDDSSSLAVLYDSASVITSLTNVAGASSKLSLKFRFDGELLRSKIYQGAVRSLLRRAIHGSNGSKIISESAKSFSQPDPPIRDISVVRLSKVDNSIIEDEMEYEMEPWREVTLVVKHNETDTLILKCLMKQPKEDDLDIGTSGTTTTTAESSLCSMLINQLSMARMEKLSTMIVWNGTATLKWSMFRLHDFAAHKTGGLNLATLDCNKFCFLEPLELPWSTEFDVPRIQDEVSSNSREITVIVFSYNFSLCKWTGLEQPFIDALRAELERFRKIWTLLGFYKIEKLVFLFIVDFFPEKIMSKPLGQHPDLVSGGSWALAAYSIFKEFLKSNLPDSQTLSYLISSSDSFLQ